MAAYCLHINTPHRPLDNHQCLAAADAKPLPACAVDGLQVDLCRELVAVLCRHMVVHDWKVFWEVDGAHQAWLSDNGVFVHWAPIARGISALRNCVRCSFRGNGCEVPLGENSHE